MSFHVLILAYFGPETVLPMTSVVATVVGVFMMFGRNTLRLVFRWRRAGRELPNDAASARSTQYLKREPAQAMAERR
jgi:hypothetical protein